MSLCCHNRLHIHHLFAFDVRTTIRSLIKNGKWMKLYRTPSHTDRYTDIPHPQLEFIMSNAIFNVQLISLFNRSVTVAKFIAQRIAESTSIEIILLLSYENLCYCQTGLRWKKFLFSVFQFESNNSNVHALLSYDLVFSYAVLTFQTNQITEVSKRRCLYGHKETNYYRTACPACSRH